MTLTSCSNFGEVHINMKLGFKLVFNIGTHYRFKELSSEEKVDFTCSLNNNGQLTVEHNSLIKPICMHVLDLLFTNFHTGEINMPRRVCWKPLLGSEHGFVLHNGCKVITEVTPYMAVHQMGMLFPAYYNSSFVWHAIETSD